MNQESYWEFAYKTAILLLVSWKKNLYYILYIFDVIWFVKIWRSHTYILTKNTIHNLYALVQQKSLSQGKKKVKVKTESKYAGTETSIGISNNIPILV